VTTSPRDLSGGPLAVGERVFMGLAPALSPRHVPVGDSHQPPGTMPNARPMVPPIRERARKLSRLGVPVRAGTA
jgi:hypothetical protein